MKVPTYTYECDLCHKPCKRGEFVIPQCKIVPVEARVGKDNKVPIKAIKAVREEICDVHMDLCDGCREKVAHMIELVPDNKWWCNNGNFERTE